MAGDTDKLSTQSSSSTQALLPVENGSANPHQKFKTPAFVYVLTCMSALGGFLFGYDTGVVSGSMLLIRDQLHLDHLWHEAIVTATIAAAGVFALVGGAMSDWFGRKTTILGASFTFAAGSVLMGAAREKYMLLAGRIVVGCGIGMVSSTVPMYIAEAAPSWARGKLVSFHVVMVTGGQLMGTIIAGAFSQQHTNGWRYMLGLSGIPAVIQFVGFLGMPESPRWLVSKGKPDLALKVLRAIRGTNAPQEVDEEMEAIRNACRDVETDRKERGSSWTFFLILRTPTVRRALFLGCGLQFFQQLSGINTVMYYTAPIIKMAGVTDDVTAIWLSAATAGVNFVCTFIGVYLVEKVGRRPLLLISLLGVVFSLLVLGAGFQISDLNAPQVSFVEQKRGGQTDCDSYISCATCTKDPLCGFCFIETSSNSADNGSCIPLDPDSQLPLYGRCHLVNGSMTANAIGHSPQLTWAIDWCPSSFTWIILLGLMLYLLFFAPGMGPMPWTINSEIYPLWARGTAYSIATSVNWGTNIAVSMSFLTLTEVMTKEGTFYMYAVLSAIGFVYFYCLLPETKEKTLEEVEGLFATPQSCICPTNFSNSSAPNASTKTVQYVHIRGLNRGYRDSNDSGDEDS